MTKHSTPLIYLVDDDDDDRYLLQTIFTKHFGSCVVRSFDTGSSLITQLTHKLDGRLPDLIILDLEMPVFNGFELLHYLKNDSTYQSIPVAVMSGSQHHEHRDRCYALGTTTFLTKTINYSQLVSRLGNLQQIWSQARLDNTLGHEIDALSDTIETFDFSDLRMN